MLNISSAEQRFEAILHAAECLFTFEDITRALDRMASAITAMLHQERPLILCVMTGALMVTSHLLARLPFLLEVDYIHATRYGLALTGGDLTWLARPHSMLTERTVLIVDDIMDGGLTLAAIVEDCYKMGARAAYTAVLINKLRQREQQVTISPDFIGLETADPRYFFGFGLDYEGYGRNLPAIYAITGG